jgi:hypothetical protein
MHECMGEGVDEGMDEGMEIDGDENFGVFCSYIHDVDHPLAFQIHSRLVQDDSSLALSRQGKEVCRTELCRHYITWTLLLMDYRKYSALCCVTRYAQQNKNCYYLLPAGSLCVIIIAMAADSAYKDLSSSSSSAR